MSIFIDVISKDRRRLSGWIQVDHEDDEPFIRVRRHGRSEKSRISILPPRQDVIQKLGLLNRAFAVELNESLGPLEMLAQSFSIEVVRQSGVEVARMSSGCRKAEIDVARADLNIGPALSGGQPGSGSPTFPDNRADLSPMLFPVGLSSADGTAVLGRQGFLFLRTGSNDLLAQYVSAQAPNEPEAQDPRARQWAQLVADRRSTTESYGAGFLQIVTPDKLSMLGRLSPLGTVGATRLARGLDRELGESPWYLNGTRIAGRLSSPDEAWSRVDTHLAPRGAHALCTLAVQRLTGGSDILDSVPFDSVLRIEGDLGRRFFSVPLLEDLPAPDPGLFLNHEAAPAPQTNLGPENNPQTGSVRRWTRRSAPINAKLLCFGTSTFGNGDTSTRLSWWLSRLFTEYTFKWTTGFDEELVRRIEPDFVICETVDRKSVV